MLYLPFNLINNEHEYLGILYSYVDDILQFTINLGYRYTIICTDSQFN